MNPMNNDQFYAEILPRIINFSIIIALITGQVLQLRQPYLTSNYVLFTVGTILALIGLGLWMYTGKYMSERHAFTEKQLLDNGPFRIVRHPMYTGSFVFFIGLGLLFFDTVWLYTLVVAFPFLLLSFKLEEHAMIKVFDQEYKDYQSRTGLILPFIPLF